MTRQMRWASLVSLGVAVAVGAVGCLGDNDSSDDGTSTSIGALSLGDALPGTNATTFAAAKANFEATETQADGLGPIFNERSCSACHSVGATGGAGQNIERRYGTLINGVFNGLANTGGSLRQLFGIGGFTPSVGLNCQSGTDANPAPGATIFAGRVTTPTLGAGLVELIPDSTILAIAAAQPAAIRGVANFDTIHLTDGPFVRGQSHVARFGWKAVHASVTDFAADAYLNEMGITTTSCAAGAVVSDFATENRANRAATNAVINGCPDDDKPGVDDDFAAENNNCAGGLTAVQDDVANFAFFMRNSAAPPRGDRQQQRPWPDGVQPRRLQRVPRDHHVHRQHQRPERQLPAVLRLPHPRHGDAGRRDRQRRRLGGDDAADADRAAVGPALPQRPAARRADQRQGDRHRRPRGRQQRSGLGRGGRIRCGDLGGAERSAAVPVVALAATEGRLRALAGLEAQLFGAQLFD